MYSETLFTYHTYLNRSKAYINGWAPMDMGAQLSKVRKYTLM